MCKGFYTTVGGSNFEKDINDANGALLFIYQQTDEDSLPEDSTKTLDYYSQYGFKTGYYVESVRPIAMVFPARAVINLLTGELIHKDTAGTGIAESDVILNAVKSIK
jgi:hypothetical protein